MSLEITGLKVDFQISRLAYGKIYFAGDTVNVFFHCY